MQLLETVLHRFEVVAKLAAVIEDLRVGRAGAFDGDGDQRLAGRFDIAEEAWWSESIHLVRSATVDRKKNTKGQVISKRKDCRHPDLTGQNEFIRTLEAQAKSLGIPPEHARDKLVMHLDLK